METTTDQQASILRNMFISTIVGSYKGIKDSFGDEGVKFLINTHIQGVQHQLAHQMKNMQLEKGLNGFRQYLATMDKIMGFENEVEQRSDNEFVVKCTRCPFVNYAQRMNVGPEFCKDVSRAALEAEVKMFFPNVKCETTSTILEGKPSCETIVRTD
jgi:predicted ArsR family transcriptional regulator